MLAETQKMYQLPNNLVVGSEYNIASGLGGCFDVVYQGLIDSKCQFKVVTKGWEKSGPYRLELHEVNDKIYLLEI